MAKHNEIGKLGEDLAAKWLVSRNFVIIERNYLKKYGEIDIVARETEKIHFIEVKSVSYETKSVMEIAVSHGTWRPEENVHYEKQKRMSRVIETWLAENSYVGKWQIDILSVRIVPRERIARFNLIDNVIFE
jgi:putative endonuclease